MERSILDSAIDYALRYRWKVVPLYGVSEPNVCKCDKHGDCPSPGKHPCLTKWQTQATIDTSKIQNWFTRGAWPKLPANVGIQLGPESNLVDIESDSEEGLAKIKEAFGGEMPRTPYFRSGRGGLHYLFQYRDDLPGGANVAFPGFDLKFGHGNLGSQSVFPPSIHSNGKHYEWVVSPEECEIAEIPDTAVDFLKGMCANRGNGDRADWRLALHGAETGSRNNALTSYIGLVVQNIHDTSNVVEIGIAFRSVQGVNRGFDPPLGDVELLTCWNSILSKEKQRRVEVGGKDQFNLETVSMTELLGMDLVENFLIEDILIEGQPCIVGGPKKVMKTSTLVDLAVSLVSETPFLGKFEVLKSSSVLMISGESGFATLRDIAQTIFTARNLDPAADWPLFFSRRLPGIGIPDQMAIVRQEILEKQIGVLILDPAYLSLLKGTRGVSPSDVFAMGQLLSVLSDLGADTGCTILLAHHTRKLPTAREYAIMDLSDLSMSGFAEWARQWLLINRTAPHTDNGYHQIGIAVGGSAGFSGKYSVEIYEGKPRDPIIGRYWETKVQSFQKGDFSVNPDMTERIFEFIQQNPNCAKSSIRKGTGQAQRVVQDAIAALLDNKRIVEVTIKSANNRAFQYYSESLSLDDIFN